MKPLKNVEEAQARRKKVAELYRQGVAREFIAMRLGIKRGTVNTIIRELTHKNELSRNRYL